jgi:hypothetical protein
MWGRYTYLGRALRRPGRWTVATRVRTLTWRWQVMDEGEEQINGGLSIATRRQSPQAFVGRFSHVIVRWQKQRARG